MSPARPRSAPSRSLRIDTSTPRLACATRNCSPRCTVASRRALVLKRTSISTQPSEPLCHTGQRSRHRRCAACSQAALPARHSVQRAPRRHRRLHPKIGVEFDAICAAGDIGFYKSADANFAYLLAHLKSDLGLDRSEVLHTAQSLYHDHAPANRFGLANVWIDRQRLSEGGSSGARRSR